MRSRLLSLLVLGAALAGCGARASHDRATGSPTAQPFGAQPVSVTLETPGQGALPGGLFGGALYFAGEEGQPYAIRITNNTATRVEAVVSVDGRDVVTGAIGDYRKQRGYIVEPFGSVVIDGFRQSFTQVAAFRFTGLAGSYTALQGTPQHAGVIGVAVFEERVSRKKPGPLAVGTGDPFPANATARAEREERGHDDAGRRSAPEPFVQGGASRHASESEPASASPSMPMADEAPGDGAASAKASESAGSGFAPPPVPRNELGTEYGESQASSVYEAEFKRKHKRRPETVISVYYDSARGLEARGVPVGGAVAQDSRPVQLR